MLSALYRRAVTLPLELIQGELEFNLEERTRR